MSTIKIIDARNKTLIGKEIKLNENGVVIMGKKEFTIKFNIHQPNKEIGDYSVHNYKIEDLQPFQLLRIDSDHLNKGIWIEKYEIN